MSELDVTSGADTAGEAPAGGGAGTARHRPSGWRAAFYVVSATILVWAAVAVPLPYVEYLPGRPADIEPLLEIDGVETTDLDGRTALLTVLLRQQPTVQSLRALLDDQRRLLPVSQVFPPGTDRDHYYEAERERFGRQFEIAAAIGAQAAGIEAELITEAVVVDVLPGSPADGVLRPGDVVLRVEGSPVVAAEEIQARTRAGRVGETLRLTLLRDGERIETEVRLGEIEGSEYPAMGIAVQTAVDRLQLPFEVDLAEDTRIGGPSAGMMVAVTTYDLISEEDLLDGRLVLGTGTVDADGRIGPVGGVPEKMLAAAEYGADVVLVPAIQLEEALSTAPDDLDVVGVGTLDEALDALRETA